MRRSRPARVAGAALVVAAAVLFLESPAAAHARLKSRDPRAEEIRATAPLSVDLRFDEPVDADLEVGLQLVAAGRGPRRLR